MSRLQVGDKVHIKGTTMSGKIISLNRTNKSVKVDIGDDVIEVTEKFVTLWSTLSWLVKFFIRIFKSKN